VASKLNQCERCGAALTPEEVEGNFQEHDCSEVLAEREQQRIEAYD